MPAHSMTCCVCGNGAGRWEQHWNRDTGYGICPRCAAEQSAIEAPERMLELYGAPGVNYRQPAIHHLGRRYEVLATAKTQAQADSFMERTPGASVLLVDDGGIYLVRQDDLGTPIQT